MSKTTKICLIVTAAVWGLLLLAALGWGIAVWVAAAFGPPGLPDADRVRVRDYTGDYELTLQIEAREVYDVYGSVVFFDADESLEEIAARLPQTDGQSSEIVNGYLVIERNYGDRTGFYAVHIGEDGRYALLNMSAVVEGDAERHCIPLPYFFIDFEGTQIWDANAYFQAGESAPTGASYAEWKEFYAVACKQPCSFDDAAETIACEDVLISFAAGQVTFSEI